MLSLLLSSSMFPQQPLPRKRDNNFASDGMPSVRGAMDWAALYPGNDASRPVHNACHNAWRMAVTSSITLGLGAKTEIATEFPPRVEA
jgi:hypothetical protein